MMTDLEAFDGCDLRNVTLDTLDEIDLDVVVLREVIHVDLPKHQSSDEIHMRCYAHSAQLIRT